MNTPRMYMPAGREHQRVLSGLLGNLTGYDNLGQGAQQFTPTASQLASLAAAQQNMNPYAQMARQYQPVIGPTPQRKLRDRLASAWRWLLSIHEAPWGTR